jgi:hypothetical protein
MPTPRKGETESDFVTRCIPVVLDDGTAKDTKQATAICFSMYAQAKKEARAKGQIDLRDGLSDPARISKLRKDANESGQ